MLIRVFQRARRAIAGTFLERALKMVGLGKHILRCYEALVLKRAIHQVRVCGHNFVFRVSSASEISQLDMQSLSEEQFIRRIAQACRPGDVFYDVGANIGVTTLSVSRLSGPEVVIHAYEPHPTNAQHLRENIAANGMHDVQVHEIALSDRTGIYPFFLSEKLGIGTHSLIPRCEVATQVLEVHTLTGDRAVKECGQPPSVIKIDVEGAEMAVIAGFSASIKSGNIRDMFVEVHPDQLARANYDHSEFEMHMSAYGYEVVWSALRSNQRHVHLRLRQEPDRRVGMHTNEELS